MTDSAFSVFIMELKNIKKAGVEVYLPIYLEAMRLDTFVDFDLFIKIGREHILYRAADLPFNERTRSTLLDNNVTHLYILASAKKRYQRYIESNIKQIINDETIPEATKAGIIYDSSKLLVRDVLDNPTLGDNIHRAKKMVENHVDYILRGNKSFHNLLDLMSFDYYTYTHSVNVCTFSVAFAQYLGYDDEEFLNNLGTGALLHDVGKTRIADSILNKKARLTPDEMNLIRKHPKWGVQIIKETKIIEEASLYPVIQHHEREDGSGYPFGSTGNDIHIYGKIVGIADSFDAMTTRRVYQDALSTFTALKTMFSLNGAYDQKLLEKFARLMGPASMAKK